MSLCHHPLHMHVLLWQVKRKETGVRVNRGDTPYWYKSMPIYLGRAPREFKN